MTALRLFARDGYEAVSVSKIAGELGMTKGALYKHYKNKRDIFDCIVSRLIELDKERAIEFDVPVNTIKNTPETYEHTGFNRIKKFTIAQFKFWTVDEFTSNTRKMLSLEQYRNPEMNELYQKYIVGGPVTYIEDIFREMINHKILKKADPRQLAIEYFAPMFLLINMSDANTNNEDVGSRLEYHIERFIEHNTI